MRQVVYSVATSLDGLIAGPNGESDWIVMDPEIDFAGIMAQFDTFLIGRKTFDAMNRMGNASKSSKGVTNIVFSRTLKPSDYPKVRIEADAERVVKELKAKPGKDIAIPVLPPPAARVTLKLRSQRVYKKTGTLGVEYDIVQSSIGSRGSEGSVG